MEEALLLIKSEFKSAYNLLFITTKKGHRPYVLYILVMQWKLKIVLQNITAIFHDIEGIALFIVDHNALIAREV